MNPFSGHAPCPKCSCPYSDRIKSSLLIGALGVALFCPVQCINCGKRFNGRTGRPNFLLLFLYAAAVSVGGYFLYMWLEPRLTAAVRRRASLESPTSSALVCAAERGGAPSER